MLWPAASPPKSDGDTLPAYARRVLETRLKDVLIYGADPLNLEIRVTKAVADVAEKSAQRVGGSAYGSPGGSESAARDQSIDGFLFTQPYRRVSVSDFLNQMADCFETPDARA